MVLNFIFSAIIVAVAATALWVYNRYVRAMLIVKYMRWTPENVIPVVFSGGLYKSANGWLIRLLISGMLLRGDFREEVIKGKFLKIQFNMFDLSIFACKYYNKSIGESQVVGKLKYLDQSVTTTIPEQDAKEILTAINYIFQQEIDQLPAISSKEEIVESM